MSLEKIRKFTNIPKTYNSPDDSFVARGAHLNRIVKEVNEIIDNITATIDTYTYLCVEKTGSDITGDGSESNPFASLKKALDSIAYHTINSVVSIKIGAGEFTWEDDELNSLGTLTFTHNGGIALQGSYTELLGDIEGSVDATDPFKFNVTSHTFTEDEYKFQFFGNSYSGPQSPISHNGTNYIETNTPLYDKVFSLDTKINLVNTDSSILNVGLNASFRFFYFDLPDRMYVDMDGPNISFSRLDHGDFISRNVVSHRLRLDGCMLYFKGDDYGSISAHDVKRCFFYDPGPHTADRPALSTVQNINGLIFEGWAEIFELNSPFTYNWAISYTLDSDASLKVKNCNTIINSSRTEKISLVMAMDRLIIEESSPYLIKSLQPVNMRVIIPEVIGTLAGIYETTYPHKTLVDPANNLSISVDGFYGETEVITDTTLSDNTTTDIIVGDITQNQSVTVEYTLVRNSVVESGTLTIAHDGTNIGIVESTPVQPNGDPGISFAVSIDTNDIVLECTLTSTGNNGTLNANVRRSMI